MKVTEKNMSPGAAGITNTKNADKKNQAGKTLPDISKSGDLDSAKVKLSDKATDLKKIKEQVDSTPDVDEAKVQKYKSLLAKGEYKVDAKAVADKMVDEHLKNDFFAATFKDE